MSFSALDHHRHHQRAADVSAHVWPWFYNIGTTKPWCRATSAWPTFRLRSSSYGGKVAGMTTA
jgi:hypothetical protein